MPVAFHRSAVKGSLVIATDGLFKYASADAIGAAVSTEGDAAKAAQNLARLAQLPSRTYQDDVAIVVVLLDP
jgi:serine/threonine protein phosphatase PrpC